MIWLKALQITAGYCTANQTVDRVLIENNGAKGVRTKDGNTYEAKCVVFAGALKRLYTELIDPGLLDPSMIHTIRTAPLSEPLTALYLGVDMSHAELRRYLKTHHTLFFPEGPVPDYDAAKINSCMLLPSPRSTGHPCAARHSPHQIRIPWCCKPLPRTIGWIPGYRW